MDVEARDLVHHGLRDHVDREIAVDRGQGRFERGQPGRGEQQGADAQLGGQELTHHKLALGDEQAALLAQPAVLQIAVVREPGVVERGLGQEVNVDGHGAGADHSSETRATRGPGPLVPSLHLLG